MPVYGLHAQRIHMYEKKNDEKRKNKLQHRLSKSHLDLDGLGVPEPFKQSRSHHDLKQGCSRESLDRMQTDQEALFKQLARNAKNKRASKEVLDVKKLLPENDKASINSGKNMPLIPRIDVDDKIEEKIENSGKFGKNRPCCSIL